MVTHLTWGGLYISPLWLCRKPPEHPLHILLEKQGRKENTQSALRGYEGYKDNPKGNSPGESVVVTHQHLVTQSLQRVEEPGKMTS